MGRFKVPMEFINNDKKRNLTFKTRKTGIIKKAVELTTLCDVNVSMIICSTDHHQEPTIFPPDHHKLASLTDLYRRNRIMEPQKMRYYSLSDYFEEKRMKVEEELVKAKQDNLEAKYPTWFDFINDYSEVQLRELAFGLGTKIDVVKNKVELLKNISKIQNQDKNTMSPTTVLDVQSSSIMPPLNPCLEHYDNLTFDPEVLFVDENNDDLISFDPKELFADEDENKDNNLRFDPEVLFSHENNKNHFNLQSPQPPYCCLPEILQQPEPPLFSDQINFNMQSCNTDSVMKLQSSNLTDENFRLQFATPTYCFQPEIPQHPEPPPFSDQNSLIMRSSKPDSMMNLLTSKDDNDYCHPLPQPAYCSPEEIVQQPEQPLFYSIYQNLV